MLTQIKCPNCGESFEANEALKHEIEEELTATLAKKYKNEIEEARREAEKNSREKISKELKDREEQIAELKKRANEAEAEELKMRKEKRALEEAKQKFETEKQRELDREREIIRLKAQEEEAEKTKFKEAEYRKQIEDMKKALEDAKRKGDQVSQQLQGEVLELDIENMLRTTFTDDEIIPVGKGHEGGDIIHKVKGKSGNLAGVILWETKRANWQKAWLSKLRENGRKEGATISVLASINLPDDIKDFQLVDGSVICSYKYILPLAAILRRSVLHIAYAEKLAENKDEKLQILYDYLQSEAFRHRFEALSEATVELKNDLEAERRAMERIWKKREVQVNKMQVNTARMYGELQGVMGNALPDIEQMSLPGGEDETDL